VGCRLSFSWEKKLWLGGERIPERGVLPKEYQLFKKEGEAPKEERGERGECQRSAGAGGGVFKTEWNCVRSRCSLAEGRARSGKISPAFVTSIEKEEKRQLVRLPDIEKKKLSAWNDSACNTPEMPNS